MRVAEIWRFPVKSFQGEQLDGAAITADGLEGDRRFALVNVETGAALTARREPRLLHAAARMLDDRLEITLPDGLRASSNDEFSAWLGYPVELIDGHERSESLSAECPTDETEAQWFSYTSAARVFHDADIWRVSMVSTASLGKWDRRRFRANLVLEGEGEDELVGREVAVGCALLHVQSKIPRCVMVTRPQPGGIERDVDVLRTINRELESHFAIGATVVQTGAIAVGDTLS